MNHSSSQETRRSFIKKSAIFGGLTILPANFVLGQNSSNGNAPSGKVNVACIGIGNKGAGNIQMLHSSGHCNIVALCDIDLKGRHTQGALKKFPKAKRFTDFRKMFDAMADEIDAVIVSTQIMRISRRRCMR